ncbi:hypothetical protein MAP00_007463 [Monascus purpureus]|nr:hypothetical protein MAP00_007463 [Monascus purpureus]
MAELSIASGIVGLLSLGIQVTQSLISFYSAYKDQDGDLAKITQNFEDLQGIFQSLESAVQDRQSQGDMDEVLKEVDKAMQGCHEIIEELQKECQKLHTDLGLSLKGHIQVAGRRAAYPFRKSTLQKLKEDVSEICESLSLALNVLQLKSYNQTQYELLELKSLLERINTSQFFSMIRNWLMAPDAFIDHNAIYAKRHPSTGLWFINSHHFTDWLVEHNSFLWINGVPGCGKSFLCSTTIEHTFHEIKDKHEVGIAFFYFSFTDKMKQSSYGMLCALLLQLSVQLQDGEKDLEQLHRLYKLGTPPVGALLDSLRSVLCRFHEAFILLDALDESPQDCGREGVLEAIETIRKWDLPGLHLLVTSRDLLDISQSLNPSHGQAISMKNPGVNRDIAIFVSDQLKEDQQLQRWKARHSDIQEQLTQHAQGVFRYANCQLKELRRHGTRTSLTFFYTLCLRILMKHMSEFYAALTKTMLMMFAEF